MNTSTEEHKKAFEKVFSAEAARWHFHDTQNQLIRYLRDRRLNIALGQLTKMIGEPLIDMSVLIVCGGVGGEATFFANHGFKNVTNTDFATNALRICEHRDPRVKRLQINAEAIELSDESVDLVIVQDGLHHLPRPVLGLNEMIRIARRGVAVIEPHAGLVARAIGTEWERQEDTVNYVFRWNDHVFRSVILSQCLQRPLQIRVLRIWDHGSIVHKIVSGFGGAAISLLVAKVLYGCLSPFNAIGNGFIGLLTKDAAK